MLFTKYLVTLSEGFFEGKKMEKGKRKGRTVALLVLR